MVNPRHVEALSVRLDDGRWRCREPALQDRVALLERRRLDRRRRRGRGFLLRRRFGCHAPPRHFKWPGPASFRRIEALWRESRLVRWHSSSIPLAEPHGAVSGSTPTDRKRRQSAGNGRAASPFRGFGTRGDRERCPKSATHTLSMLLQLDVANLVLIEEEHLELGPGFHVLTGETGAGKSMLVDALGLVLGVRARPDWVRAGAKEAEVSALFDIGADAEILQVLEGFGIPVENGELVVRRIVQGEGRSRAYLNGRMATASQLQEVGPLLCDIASQHESVRLTDAATHGAYLDAYAGLDGMRVVLAATFQELSALERRRETLQSKLRTRAEQEDYLSFQLREIDELDPKEGEETDLLQRRGRLRHAGRLSKATREAADRLYESESAICDELHRISGELAQAAELDGSLAPLARTVDAARAELADAARELGRYAEGVEANPAELPRGIGQLRPSGVD
ncbi:MAG: hypothetical protein EOP08_04750, partial [Proteobacteria bacterium]